MAELPPPILLMLYIKAGGVIVIVTLKESGTVNKETNSHYTRNIVIKQFKAFGLFEDQFRGQLFSCLLSTNLVKTAFEAKSAGSENNVGHMQITFAFDR